MIVDRTHLLHTNTSETTTTRKILETGDLPPQGSGIKEQEEKREILESGQEY